MGTVITNSNGDFIVDEFNRTFSLEDIPDASGISIPDHSILFQFSDMSFDPRTVEKYNQLRWSRVAIEGYNLWYWRNTNAKWDFAPFGQSTTQYDSIDHVYKFTSTTPSDRLSEHPYRVLKMTDMTGVIAAQALFAHCHNLTEILCDIEFPDLQLRLTEYSSSSVSNYYYFYDILDYCWSLRKCGDIKIYSNDNDTSKSSVGQQYAEPQVILRLFSPVIDRVPDFYFAHRTLSGNYGRVQSFYVSVVFPYMLSKGGKSFFADSNETYSVLTNLSVYQIDTYSSNYPSYFLGGWQDRTPGTDPGHKVGEEVYYRSSDINTIFGYAAVSKNPYDKMARMLPLRFVNNKLVEGGREIVCAPFSAFTGPATTWPRFFFSTGTTTSDPYQYPSLYTGCPFIKELETNFVNYTLRDGTPDKAHVHRFMYYGCFGAENVVESVTNFDSVIGANRSSGMNYLYVSAGINTSAGRYNLRVNVPTKYGGGSTQYLRNNLGTYNPVMNEDLLGSARSKGCGNLVFPAALAATANNRILDFYYQISAGSAATRSSDVAISKSDFVGYGSFDGRTGSDESKLYVRMVLSQRYSGWKMYSSTPIWEITSSETLSGTSGKWFTLITPPAFDTSEGTFDPMETIFVDILARPTDDVDVDNGYGLIPTTTGTDRFQMFTNDWNIRYDLTQLD